MSPSPGVCWRSRWILGKGRGSVCTPCGVRHSAALPRLQAALTAFVIGSALLLLSAFWQNARAVVVGLLPDNLANQLPATTRSVSLQPAS